MGRRDICCLCGKSKDQVEKLILGLHGAVCSECSDRLSEALHTGRGRSESLAPFEDPNWPRASDWLNGACFPNATDQLSVLGAPLCKGSLTPGRTDQAPSAVRSALARFSCYDLVANRDVRELRAIDMGDLPIAESTVEGAFETIRDGVASSLRASVAAVLLGGDNAITRPGVHGLGFDLETVGVITLDAHFDLRDTERGLNNGNPIRALLEDGLRGAHVVQIGIQSFANSAAYAEVARTAGINVATMEHTHRQGIEAVVDTALATLSGKVQAIYVDLDLDVMDRCFALGTPGSRPGGLAPWQLVVAARMLGAHHLVRAIDLVELDPQRDTLGTTAMTAAMCALSFASGVASRAEPRK